MPSCDNLCKNSFVIINYTIALLYLSLLIIQIYVMIYSDYDPPCNSLFLAFVLDVFLQQHK